MLSPESAVALYESTYSTQSSSRQTSHVHIPFLRNKCVRTLPAYVFPIDCLCVPTGWFQRERGRRERGRRKEMGEEEGEKEERVPEEQEAGQRSRAWVRESGG